MSVNDEPGSDRYAVVMNAEEQFSIWRVGKPIPSGWTHTGFEATETECLAHIETVWTDMRPKSVRDATSHPVADASPRSESGSR